MQQRTFAAADYAVFAIVLFISAVIGIFFAIRDRRSANGTEGYLMANRSMGMFPVALSLTVSFMSAITVLGTPSEVYLHGTMFWWFVVVFFVVATVTSQIYIPTYYRLGITSTYEYLERRFNRTVRILGTLTFIVENIMYIGIVIYAPALALSEVTGINLWFAVLSTGLVCTFYTTLGGLKAVIWTDVFQSVIMCAGFLAVIIKGAIVENGMANVWSICEEGGRIDFLHFETDVRIRHTFWSIIVGGTVLWLGLYAVGQSQVQRYLCCKSQKQAVGALFLNVLGVFIIISLACLCGLVMYAHYYDCDPLSRGCVGKSDQLIPYLVLDILSDSPGVPGLFVSCVFSGSLSTVSSGINAMATVTIEDFIKPLTNLKENTYTWISKGLVVIFGLASIGMAVLASFLGEILQAALSIFGIVGGPLVGLFTMGLMIPFCNSIGAGGGLLSGLALTSWIYIGSKSYPPREEFVGVLSFSTSCNDSCSFVTTHPDNITIQKNDVTNMPYAVTEVMTTTTAQEYPRIADFYAISYLYLGCVGLLGSIIIGMILSILTGGWKQRKKVDPKLLTPFFEHLIFRWISRKVRYYLGCCMDQEYGNDDFNSEKMRNEVALEIYENRNATYKSTYLPPGNPNSKETDGWPSTSANR